MNDIKFPITLNDNIDIINKKFLELIFLRKKHRITAIKYNFLRIKINYKRN